MNNMNNMNNMNPDFSHIYIEEDIFAHPVTQRILSRLPDSTNIMVKHYKDVFCKKNQHFSAQAVSRKLILAKKRDTLLYKGSPFCDDFGNSGFFYTTDIMNCVYQCEYCFLQGMYPSANIVIFVNLEDTFKEIERHLEKKKMYVCISYESDLTALDHLTDFISEWIGFADRNDNLTVEMRTKSAGFASFASIKTPPKNFILAWSISPEKIIQKYEKRTPSLKARLESIERAIQAGWNVRICIDPILRVHDWKSMYEELAEQIKEKIPMKLLYGISAGVFRLPKKSLKVMRSRNPQSSLLAYPYTLTSTGWSYDENQIIEMTGLMIDGIMAMGGLE